MRVYVLKYLSILFMLHLALRRPALGWPLAVSQEERLSYGVGSPLAHGGLVISLSGVYLGGSASVRVTG